MAAEKFAELVRRLHPDVSVRQVELRGGLPKGSIGYFLKPSTRIARMPTATMINRLAEALGCHPTEVSKAFAASLDISWTQQLSADEEALLAVMRSLTPAGQETLLHLGKALTNIHGNKGLTERVGGNQELTGVDDRQTKRSLAPFRPNYHSGSVPD